MASVPPLASDLRLHGDVSLCTIGLPQPLLGDPRHLWFPAKHSRHSFCVSEGITNRKTLHEDVKATLNRAGSRLSVIPGFYAKTSTHHMYDPGSIVPHIWPKSVHR
jgi:hypothetical protein